MMKRYKPSNIAPNDGKKLLAISSVATGVVIGGVVAFISQFFYFIVLFPLVMGGASGAAIAWAVHKGKVRNPLVAMSFAALSGLVMYGTMNYGQYLLFWQEAFKTAEKEMPQTDRATVNQMLETYLKEQTDSSGFVGYLKYAAKKGIDITKSGSKIHLDETFTWFYWLIELAVIEGLAIAAARAAALAPFSEDANDWYDAKQLIGMVENSAKEEILGYINNEHFGKVGSMLDLQGDIPYPHIELHMQSCTAAPSSDSILFLSTATKDSKGNVALKELCSGLISPLQRADLTRAIEEKKTAQNSVVEPKEEKAEEQ
ncbi:hypothetical protein V2H45_24090 [Tumidithrix elongata RA019]|uniref:Uncharacterized protein n=1 Tax=Tumidithrix elongata BACA0141 TaxID=2716417 RepID=A0AAW9QBJ2_9CYAN|nr:hypothetical protein [Tumidithrix elongata RA019]